MAARRRLVVVAVLAPAALALADCARRAPLLDPEPRALAAEAPDSFRVAFETTRGRFVVLARRHWAPRGVDRFHYLVRHGFYDETRFFRAVRRFVVQFGISGDTAVSRAWRARRIADDSVRVSNLRGRLTFARGGPNTRTTQLFINLVDNVRLDTSGTIGFPPIAEVVEGMAVVDSLHTGYGEGPPRGRGPAQDSINRQGNAYLIRAFPKLDAVVRARVEREWK